MRYPPLLALLLCSCVDQAYVGRMGEIEASKAKGEITQAEYLSLKNGVEQTYAEGHQRGGLRAMWDRSATRKAAGQ